MCKHINGSFYLQIRKWVLKMVKLGLSIGELKIGDKATHEKVITQKDIEMFGEITGDYNPAHFDEDYAKTTIFKKKISHGMLIGSLFSTILGTQLPGPGSIYVSQTLRFRKPVYFWDKITALVTVKEVNIEKNRVLLDCVAYNQDNETVVIGEALMMPPVKETTHE